MLDKSKTYIFDSRKATAGDCFICLPNGKPYVEEALEKGVVDIVHLNRKEFAIHANDYFNNVTKNCCLIGITGTNGKTSVAMFVQQILSFFDERALSIGTLNSSLTTPESWDILEKVNHYVESGGTYVILEVSSHGLDQFRVYGFDFDIKCLTNITQDHLDYHKTFENYKRLKLDFMEHYPGQSVFSDDVELIDFKWIPQFTGSFHLRNISTAVDICMKLGFDRETILKNIKHLIAPKGRFEHVVLGQPFSVIVDFAHTPDGLAHVLKELFIQVENNKDRLYVVFGCGGDRDTSKREKMGKIAEKYSSHIILTSDNSRSESSLSIINDIKQGIDNESNIDAVLEDRKKAISFALSKAKKGDIVLIAGKGHEQSQYCSGFSYAMNDTDIVYAEIINQRLFQTNQRWNVNQPNADSDVLFISKKETQPNVNLVDSSFKRTLLLPSFHKIKKYIQKIKGQKILILECPHRISLSRFLILLLKLKYSMACIEFVFDHEKSFEENLIGLTLIDQTTHPLIISVDPNHFGKLKILTDVLQQDHVIFGDILNNQQGVDFSIIKTIKMVLDSTSNHSMFWCFDQMGDISDVVKEQKNNENFKVIKASSWIEYYQLIIEDLLVKLGFFHESIGSMLLSWLQSSLWYQKVAISNLSYPIFVVNWDNDIIDLKQKLDFFNNNSSQVNHYITVGNQTMTVVNSFLMCDPLLERKVLYVKQTDGEEYQKDREKILVTNSFKPYIMSNSSDIHVIWKLKNHLLADLMMELI